MSDAPNKQDTPTEDDILCFVHPVRLLEYRLSKALDAVIEILTVVRPRHAPSLPKKQRSGTNAGGTKPRLDADDVQDTREALGSVANAASGCGRWLRWGMAERAGTYETELHRVIDELFGTLRCMESPHNNQDLAEVWERELSTLVELHRELLTTAFDINDEAESEWYQVVAAMHSKLTEATTGLEEMRVALGEPQAGRKRIEELYVPVCSAAEDFESLEMSVRPQLQYTIEAGGTESYDAVSGLPKMIIQTVRFISLSARERGFDPKKDQAAPMGPEPADLFASSCRTAYMLLRRFGATLAARPGMDKPAVLRQLQIDLRDDATTPSWNEERRELWFKGKLCRRFTRVAPTQMQLIDAFSEQGWLHRIKSPLDSETLHDTLANMRPNMKEIRFLRDGDGTSVRWEPV